MGSGQWGLRRSHKRDDGQVLTPVLTVHHEAPDMGASRRESRIDGAGGSLTY